MLTFSFLHLSRPTCNYILQKKTLVEPEFTGGRELFPQITTDYSRVCWIYSVHLVIPYRSKYSVAKLLLSLSRLITQKGQDRLAFIATRTTKLPFTRAITGDKHPSINVIEKMPCSLSRRTPFPHRQSVPLLP